MTQDQKNLCALFPLNDGVFRLILVGMHQLESDSRQEFGAQSQRKLKQLQVQTETEISGLLLLYSNCFVHLIESTMPVIGEFVADTLQNSQLSSVRVCFFSRTERSFPFWFSKLIDIKSLENDDTAEVSADTIAEFIMGLTSFGEEVRNTPQSNQKDVLDSIYAQSLNKIPRQDVVLKTCDVELLMLKEWSQLHLGKDYKLSIETERQWPLPRVEVPQVL